LIVHFFTGLIESFQEVACFQVVQDEIDSMILRVVPSNPGAIDRNVENRLASALRIHGARDIEIHIEVVDRIPVAPSGKRRFVISKMALNPVSVLRA
jgi:acyl-coenzyme A synthetase/AMP-(fatty) acid ligase